MPENIRLGDTVNILTGNPFKSSGYTDGPDGVRLLRGDNVSQGRIRWDNAKYWPSDQALCYHKYELRVGDIILAMDRPWIEAGLKYAELRPSDVPSLLVQRTACLRARGSLNQRFLSYLIGDPRFTEYIIGVQTGTAVPHISAKQISDFTFELPDPGTQIAIGQLLGALDDKIESNVLAVRTANELARAIFEAMFEQQDSVGLARLGDLAEVIDCLHSRKPEFVEGGRRYLVLADVRTDSRLTPLPKFTISNEDYIAWTRRIEAHEGDCLLTNVGRVGAVGQIPRGIAAAIGRNMTAIRGRKECPPAYLVEMLRSATVRREIEVKTDHGTVMSSLNVRSIPKLLVPARDVEDRHAFQDRVGGLHELQDLLLQENARLAIMRDTLLPKLMSGEIRVRKAEQIVEDMT